MSNTLQLNDRGTPIIVDDLVQRYDFMSSLNNQLLITTTKRHRKLTNNSKYCKSFHAEVQIKK